MNIEEMLEVAWAKIRDAHKEKNPNKAGHYSIIA